MANGWVKNSLARCPVRARPHCRSAFRPAKELLRVTRPLDVIYYYLPGGGVMKADRPRGRGGSGWQAGDHQIPFFYVPVPCSGWTPSTGPL